MGTEIQVLAKIEREDLEEILFISSLQLAKDTRFDYPHGSRLVHHQSLTARHKSLSAEEKRERYPLSGMFFYIVPIDGEILSRYPRDYEFEFKSDDYIMDSTLHLPHYSDAMRDLVEDGYSTVFKTNVSIKPGFFRKLEDLEDLGFIGNISVAIAEKTGFAAGYWPQHTLARDVLRSMRDVSFYAFHRGSTKDDFSCFLINDSGEESENFKLPLMVRYLTR